MVPVTEGPGSIAFKYRYISTNTNELPKLSNVQSTEAWCQSQGAQCYNQQLSSSADPSENTTACIEVLTACSCMSRQHRLGVLGTVVAMKTDIWVQCLYLTCKTWSRQRWAVLACLLHNALLFPMFRWYTADEGKGLRGVMSRVKTGGHFGWNPCSGCKTFPMVTHRASCTAQGMPSRHPKLALCCVQSYCLHCLTVACFEARAQLIRLCQMLMHI